MTDVEGRVTNVALFFRMKVGRWASNRRTDWRESFQKTLHATFNHATATRRVLCYDCIGASDTHVGLRRKIGYGYRLARSAKRESCQALLWLKLFHALQWHVGRPIWCVLMARFCKESKGVEFETGHNVTVFWAFFFFFFSPFLSLVVPTSAFFLPFFSFLFLTPLTVFLLFLYPLMSEAFTILNTFHETCSINAALTPRNFFF